MRLTLLVFLVLASFAVGSTPPNIVVIYSDDHAYQAISAYGDDRKLIETPNIDRLARQGMRFDRCLVTNSICGPARATILTGKYSHLNGFVNNSNSVFDGSQLTFPKLLQKAGYQTAMIGKWHLGSDPTGFDFWQILPGQGAYYNPPMIRMGERIKVPGYVTDIVGDVSLEWLRKRDKSKPFLLMSQHKAPHRSWEPPLRHLGFDRDRVYAEPATLFDDYAGRGIAERDQDMTLEKTFTERDAKLAPPIGLTPEQRAQWDAYYEPRNAKFRADNPTGKDLVRWRYQRYMHDYLATVKAVDENVGRVLDFLEQEGLAENTVVVYSSDQGFFLGEHGWFDKRWIFEESVRTPLIVRWPGVTKAGSTSPALVSNVDFAQTFLDLAGVPVPDEMQGRSLRPLLGGNRPADWRTAFYYQYFEYPAPHRVRPHYGVITDRFKLVRFFGTGEDYWELFDRVNDPHELKSVYGHPDYAATTADLEKELIRLRKELKVPEDVPPSWLGRTRANAAPAAPAAPPLFPGTGAHRRVITGASPEAQRYFDQGVAFVSGFNHDEGLLAMQHATRLEPECAMAWWGVALACSPHINSPGVSAERATLAREAWVQATKRSASATPAERDLIRAMGTRFSEDPKAKRGPLDEAYAAAMRDVWRAHPGDADIGAWFVDALMMLRPWDLWKKSGEAQPETAEVLAVLDATLRLDGRHPLANHLAVHAHEASPQPERGDAAAEALRQIAPGIGHLVHMSSHIDVRRGRWEQAIVANTRSIEANFRYRETAGRPLDRFLSYMGHDYHLLTFAAMMSGRSALAAQTMRDLFAKMPAEWNRESATADGYFAMHFDVMKRFGKWEEILAAPEPIEQYPHARAWRLLARGIAYAAKGDPVAARAEERAFVEARTKLPAKASYRRNPLTDVMDIAAKLLDGEILIREGRIELALTALREAVEREDNLRYSEPPAWAQPVRHALGAALLQRLRLEEAEQVYRDDLARNPDNGWSLFGLAQSLRLQNRLPAEATALEARFKEVWAKADVVLTSSCFCQPGV